MNTKIDKHEGISALMDNELDDAQRDAMLNSLQDVQERTAWDLYHQIGDCLRSDEMAVQLSPGFAARLAERLEAEPAILAPAALKPAAPAAASGARRTPRYWLGAGMAAVAALAFVLSPQLDPGRLPENTVQMNKAPALDPGVHLASNTPQPDNTPKQNGTTVNVGGTQVEMLRDPRIDSYLMAHQRFSPAISNGAQYVTRANAVASASEK